MRGRRTAHGAAVALDEYWGGRAGGARCAALHCAAGRMRRGSGAGVMLALLQGAAAAGGGGVGVGAGAGAGREGAGARVGELLSVYLCCHRVPRGVMLEMQTFTSWIQRRETRC